MVDGFMEDGCLWARIPYTVNSWFVSVSTLGVHTRAHGLGYRLEYGLES